MDTDRAKLADEFQESYLQNYVKFSYDELCAMSGRTNLPKQAGLEDFDFAVQIKKDHEEGYVEVSCFRFCEPLPLPSEFDWLKHPDIQILETRMSRWFDMFPSGKIEWPDYDYYDPED